MRRARRASEFLGLSWLSHYSWASCYKGKIKINPGFFSVLQPYFMLPPALLFPAAPTAQGTRQVHVGALVRPRSLWLRCLWGEASAADRVRPHILELSVCISVAPGGHPGKGWGCRSCPAL